MVLAAFASALVVAALPSGVSGTVLIDPARPVCSIYQPCSAPDPNEVLAFWHGTRRVATARTSIDGHFRIALAPGLYRVTLPRRAAMTRLSPVQIRVPRGRFLRVTIRVDVGIR